MNQNIHTPRHLLETLAIDHDPSHAPDARRHLAGCQSCAARLGDIARARAAYLAAYTAADFARQVAARAERARRAAAPRIGVGLVRAMARRRWLAGMGGIALALGAVALIVTPPSRRAPDEIRLKGGVTWSVFAKRGTRTWAVSEGETLQAGDRLAFTYSLAQDRYLLLLGIDDAATMVQYKPQGAAPLRLTRGPGRVPFAIELDARPGQEQLVALLSQTPLDVAAAKQAVAAAAVRARGQNRHVTSGDLVFPAEIVTFAFKKR